MCWSIFFFKQKTAYELRISVWSSDGCSSDLRDDFHRVAGDDDVVGQGEDAEIGVLAVAVPDLRRQAGEAAAQDLLVAPAGAPRGRDHQAPAVARQRRQLPGEPGHCRGGAAEKPVVAADEEARQSVV